MSACVAEVHRASPFHMIEQHQQALILETRIRWRLLLHLFSCQARACYEPEVNRETVLLSMRQAKATKCSPQRVSAKRS